MPNASVAVFVTRYIPGISEPSEDIVSVVVTDMLFGTKVGFVEKVTVRPAGAEGVIVTSP